MSKVSKTVSEGRNKDLKGAKAMNDNKKNMIRCDAGEPGKSDPSRPNNAQAKDGRSNESDRGDALGDKRGHKVEEQAKVLENTINESNESPAESIEAYDETKSHGRSHLQEAKYNKVMESINKIIQENIHLLNTKSISTNPKNEVAAVVADNEVAGEGTLNKMDSRVKQPEKLKGEIVKASNFTKKVTNTKASNCTPHGVVKTVNDVKNKSLVIKIPKHTSKLPEKPKTSIKMNRSVPDSTQINYNLQQRSASQTTGNCNSDIKRQTRYNLPNKRNSFVSTKTQADQTPKDLNKKPIALNNSKAENVKNDTITKTPSRPTKVKHLKKKHVKKIKSQKNSLTKLVEMTDDNNKTEDEHAKLYYEAWINNSVTVSADEQKLLEDKLQNTPTESANPELAPEDYTDKKFTGTIRVKCGKS